MDRGVDGKFSQPEVCRNKFLGYCPFSFLPYFHFIRNYNADPSSNPEINVPHRELNPETVAHLNINRARRRLTSLMETNALPLRQTTTHLFPKFPMLNYFIVEMKLSLNRGSA